MMPGNTIRVHRVLRAIPERVYRAFLDPDAMAKWLPPNGFTGKVHQLDAKVGGMHRMSFTNFCTGRSHSFGGQYLELVPHERIRYTDKFDDPNLLGELQCTVSLRGYLAAPNSTYCRKAFPRLFLRKPATLAGRSRLRSWRSYAADAAAVFEHLDLRNAVHIGHSTGGGEATHYVAQHGQRNGRVAKLVLIGAVPPIMVKTPANPGGLPIEVFDGLRKAPRTGRNSISILRAVPSTDSTGQARSQSPASFRTGGARP
jgi:uncharacterized protein YndB with AHSA1/START domain